MIAALLMLAQAQSAEEVFQKVEKNLREAKSLSFKYKTEMVTTDADKSTTSAGNFKLKPGNKYVMIGEFVVEGDRSTFSGKSDGKKEIGRKGNDEPSEGEPTKGLCELMTACLARGSMLLCLMGDGAPESAEGIKVSKFGEVLEMRVGKSEALRIDYTLTLKGRGKRSADYKVRLWIDKATMLPLQRTLAATDERGTAIVTEHYEEVSTAEIPDREFSHE